MCLRRRPGSQPLDQLDQLDESAHNERRLLTNLTNHGNWSTIGVSETDSWQAHK